MPMKVEAACITQKRAAAGFNADSVNINGKILSKEVLSKGYKGAGVMSGSVYFALAESEVEGFADAAVVAFNERAAAFKNDIPDALKIIGDYFNDSVYALSEMGRKSSELKSSVMYASGRSVVMAKANGTKMYVFSGGVLSEAENDRNLLLNGDSEHDTAVYRDVAVDDIFLLVNEGAARLLEQKDIEDICRLAEGSVKKIAGLISKLALSKPDSQPVSVLAMKILETDLTSVSGAEGFVADFSAFENTENPVKQGRKEKKEKPEKAPKAAEPEVPAVEKTADEPAAEAVRPVEDSAVEPETQQPVEEAAAQSEDTEAFAENIDDLPETEDEDLPAEPSRHHKRAKIFLAVAAVVIVAWILVLLAVVMGVFSDKKDSNKTGSGMLNEPDVTAAATLPETTAEETTEDETTTLAEERTTRRSYQYTPPATTIRQQPAASESEAEATEPSQSSTEPQASENDTEEPSAEDSTADSSSETEPDTEPAAAPETEPSQEEPATAESETAAN